MTNDQFPSAGESFPGMIDPIIARRARPRNFESRTSRFPRAFANRSLARIADGFISVLDKCGRAELQAVSLCTCHFNTVILWRCDLICHRIAF